MFVLKNAVEDDKFLIVLRGSSIFVPNAMLRVIRCGKSGSVGCGRWSG
jgi:hypothetical protein